MPQLTPFRGLRYARPAVTELSAVICPPYDIISAEERAALATRHPANAVHVELPESYEEAARLFATWQNDGTLRMDDHELIYVYEQRYSLAGVERRSRGFVARLSLRDDKAAPVRFHEHTMAAPKEDRFRLLSAVGANLSPVILLYEDPPGLSTADLLAPLTADQPDADAVDDRGVGHRLWTADPATDELAATLLRRVSGVPLTIADGHHRYQTAQRYCAEVGGAGSEFVLALLFEASSGGLSVLATHRLVKTDADVLAHARESFDVVPAGNAAAAVPAESGSIGVWTRGGGALLHPRAAGAQLDVAVLDAAYPALVGVSQSELTRSSRIAYTQDAAAASAAIESTQADVAFLLAPTPVSAVLSIAAAGEVMPPKSTFFYPKAATGMVFNLLAA